MAIPQKFKDQVATWAGLVGKDSSDDPVAVGVTASGQLMTSGDVGPEAHDGQGESVSYTGTAGTSAAITGTIIDVTCTTDAFVAIGAAPTAVADGTDYFVSGGLTYRFPITSGNKISAIQLSSGGTMYVHPVG